MVVGKVERIAPFGAFVRLEDGSVGMVHISQISREFVKRVEDYLQVGQEVRAVVLRNEGGKIALSIKALEEGPSPKRQQSPEDFEEKLARFKRDSKGKLADLKMRSERRQGGGR